LESKFDSLAAARPPAIEDQLETIKMEKEEGEM
jgi:hypothetical protein